MASRLKMMMMITAIGTAILVAGCGSGSDSSAEGNASGSTASQSEESSGASLSKAEFVKQVGAACAKEREEALERSTAYLEKHRLDGLPEAVLNTRALKAGLLTTFEGEMDALREAGAPEGDEEEIGAILTTFEADLEEAKKLQPKDLPEDIEKPFADSDKLLRDYGLSDCAK